METTQRNLTREIKIRMRKGEKRKKNVFSDGFFYKKKKKMFTGEMKKELQLLTCFTAFFMIKPEKLS